MKFKNISITKIVTALTVTALTLFCLILGGIRYHIQKVSYYKDLDTKVAQVASQLSTALELSIWNLDADQIQKVMESIMEVPDVYGIEVNAANQKYIRGRDQLWRPIAVDKVIPESHILIREKNVVYKGEDIGAVKIYITPRFAEARLRFYLILMVIIVVAVNLGSIVIVSFINSQIVLKPTLKIEHYASEVINGNSVNARISKEGFYGELDRLRSALEHMVRLLAERNTALQESLSDQELLIQELYHRTKNNMQIISSLLFIQDQVAGNLHLSRVIKDMMNRISAMALVHDKLFQTKNLITINLKEFVKDLVSSLMTSHHVAKDQLNVKLEMESFLILMDNAIACGLVLNELVSNSIEFATELKLEIRKIESVIQIQYQDDGAPIPPASMSMKLILMLIERQMKGTVDFDVAKKTFHIQFIEPVYRNRLAPSSAKADISL